MADKKESIADLEARIEKLRLDEAKAAKKKAEAYQKRKAVRDVANKKVAYAAQLELVRVDQAERHFSAIAVQIKQGRGTDAQKKLIAVVCKLEETGEFDCGCPPAPKKVSKKD